MSLSTLVKTCKTALLLDYIAFLSELINTTVYLVTTTGMPFIGNNFVSTQYFNRHSNKYDKYHYGNYQEMLSSDHAVSTL